MQGPSAAEIALLNATLLFQRATIYTVDVPSGRYTTVAATDVPCRLVPLDVFQQQGTGAERQEIASQRRILFEPDAVIPDDCQFLVDGERWNLLDGTLQPRRDRNTVRNLTAFVVRALV